MRFSAFVLIEDNGLFLLIQEAAVKWNRSWYLPGGKINIGENIKTGAIRETLEESGLIVELTSLFNLKYYEGPDDKMEFYFTAKVTGGTLKDTANKHSLQANWFTLQEIKFLNLRDDALQLIESFSNKISTLPENKFTIFSDEVTHSLLQR